MRRCRRFEVTKPVMVSAVVDQPIYTGSAGQTTAGLYDYGSPIDVGIKRENGHLFQRLQLSAVRHDANAVILSTNTPTNIALDHTRDLVGSFYYASS